MTNGSTCLAHPAPENRTRLTTLDPSARYIKIVNTCAVAPERAKALLTAETMRYAPGFVSANVQLNLDRTLQWRSREAIAAAGADPKVAARTHEAAHIAEGFSPILYELRHSVVAPGA